MTSLDYLIVGLYAVVLIAIATFVSKTKSGEKKTAEEYFLAGRSLPWWAIGTSLIAANIAADQIIGMNGDASPFMPIIWSAAILAAIKDVPIAHQGKDLPARKYSSAVFFSPLFVFETNVAIAIKTTA